MLTSGDYRDLLNKKLTPQSESFKQVLSRTQNLPFRFYRPVHSGYFPFQYFNPGLKFFNRQDIQRLPRYQIQWLWVA